MKRYKIQTVFFLFLILQFFYVDISAQKAEQRIISGTVTDINKQPVSGVTVNFQEKLKSVVTGKDGQFSIAANSDDEVINFSKDGYKTQQVAIAAIASKGIILESCLADDSEKDIVNIPFGERSKRQIVSSVSNINGDNLAQTANSSSLSSIYGKMSGLFMLQTGTAPGRDDFYMLIRGRSSLNDNQTPLILVDGIARDLRDMEVGEIESVTVLKDAGSLAWYGIRAGNGIISVKTRTGSSNKTVIKFNTFGGVQIPELITKPLDSYTYATLYNEGRTNAGQLPTYSQGALNSYLNPNSNKYNYPSNNLPDFLLNDNATVQHYDFSVSGGNKAARYFAFIGYDKQDGLFTGTKTPDYNSNTNYNRVNFRLNLDFNVMKNLDVSTKFGGRAEVRREPGQSNDGAGVGAVLSNLFLTPPNAFPLYNPDASLGGSSIFQANPMGLLQRSGYNDQLTRVLVADVAAKYNLGDFVKGLSASVQYSLDMMGIYTSGRTQAYEVFSRDTVTNAYTRFGTKAPLGYRSAAFTGNQRYTEFWGGLDYENSFGDHNINIAARFTNRNLKANTLLESTRADASARASYNYKQTYFVDLVGSYSGMPYFAPGKRYGFFPAISAGWIVSNSDFLQSAKMISYFKLRGSYGMTGSDAFYGSRRYPEQTLYDANGYTWAIGSSYTVFGSGFREAILPNINATFEKVSKFNAGFDSKFFNNVLSLNFDYFSEKRSDIFTNRILPAIIGNELFNINEGATEVHGFELSGDITKSVGRAVISVFGNYTFAQSSIVKYNDTPGIPEYQLQVGHPLGNLGLLYDAMGIFQTQEEIDAAPKQLISGNVAPGDIRYRDVNNDGKVDANDRIRSKNAGIPKSYYNFGARITYAGFDISALFSGVNGMYANISSIINYGTANSGYINQFSLDRWTPSTAATALWPRILISDRGNNSAASTYWIRPDNYVRLKNIELGYTLPSSLTNKLKIGGIRAFVSGQNLFTISKLKDLGIDPEIPDAGYSSTYPYMVSVTAGINLKF